MRTLSAVVKDKLKEIYGIDSGELLWNPKTSRYTQLNCRPWEIQWSFSKKYSHKDLFFLVLPDDTTYSLDIETMQVCPMEFCCSGKEIWEKNSKPYDGTTNSD